MVDHYIVLVFIFLIFNRFFAIHFRLLAIFGQGSTCCEIYLLIKDALRHPSYIVFFPNKLHAVPLKCSDIEYGGIFMVFLSCQNCGQECSDRAQRGKVFIRGKKQPAKDTKIRDTKIHDFSTQTELRWHCNRKLSQTQIMETQASQPTKLTQRSSS